MNETVKRIESKSFARRKKAILITAMSLLLCIAGSFVIPTAYADTGLSIGAGTVSNGHDNRDSLAQQRTAFEENYGNYEAIDSYFEDEEFSNQELLERATQSQSIINRIHSILSSGFYSRIVSADDAPGNVVSRSIRGIAMALIVLFSIIEMVKILTRGDGNLDVWLRIFVSAAIPILLISALDDIIDSVDGLCLFVVNKTYAAIDTQTSEDEAEGTIGQAVNQILSKLETDGVDDDKSPVERVLEAISDGASSVPTPGGTIKGWIMTLLVKIMLEGVMYAICIATFTLYLEFCIRRAFLPLAIVSIRTDGTHGTGMKYIIGYISMYLRIAMFYVVGAAASWMEAYAVSGTLATSMTNVYMGSIGAIICIRLATTATLKQTSVISKEVFGV